jgi:pycsar effector protein
MMNPDLDTAEPSRTKPHSAEILRATEFLWRIYGQINEWIRFADAKAGALLAADVVMIVAAIQSFKDHKDVLMGHVVLWFPGILSLVGLSASAFCCLMCILPRTRAIAGKSVIFFGDIARGYTSLDAYLQSASTLGDENRAFDEISRQVWENARIAEHKHLWIARAVWSIFFGLVVALVVGIGAALVSGRA